MKYINISAYKFLHLTNLERLQVDLKSSCDALGLKGTILLSAEGINLFLCGKTHDIDSICEILHAKFAPIAFKKSPSKKIPFSRMLVKIKAEIITFGINGISPAEKPAPYVTAKLFKQWQDEGKPLVILDTRNQYEIDVGKFKNAIHLNIDDFRSFPIAAKQLPEELKTKTVVTYCTGGIRCEKAAPFLIEHGFKEVYQLEGGILQYLEECGGAHFEGECFVFDDRIAINDKLEESQPHS